MNIKKRFKLIEKVTEILKIELTDIQLEFLLEDTNFNSVCYQMPRATGKDYITQLRIVIRILEELDTGNSFNMAIVGFNLQHVTKLLNETSNILAKMLPIEDAKKMRYVNTPGQKTIELYTSRIFFLKAEDMRTDMHGVRLNEAIVNEYNYGHLDQVILRLKAMLIDNEAPLFLIGTPNPSSLLYSTLCRDLEEGNFEIKRPDSYNPIVVEERLRPINEWFVESPNPYPTARFGDIMGTPGISNTSLNLN